jgi:hypothetical protein
MTQGWAAAPEIEVGPAAGSAGDSPPTTLPIARDAMSHAAASAICSRLGDVRVTTRVVSCIEIVWPCEFSFRSP